MRTFTFDGVSSDTHGIYVSGEYTYDGAAHDYKNIQIPGKSGDLILSNNRYKNIIVEYPAIIKQLTVNAQAVRSWLLAPRGYRRLESDYDTTHYRMGIFSGELSVSPWAMAWHGESSLKFDCKPQRFLLTGETAVEIDESGETITNPTAFPALPLIEISGTDGAAGELDINGTVVTINSITDGMLIDCETADAYMGALNLNADISAPEIPTLTPGANTVEWSGGITGISITPRWWEL